MTTALEKDAPATVKKHAGIRAGGAIVVMVALLTGFLYAVDLLMASSETTSRVYERQVSGLNLHVDNADVEIEPGRADRVRLIRVLEWSAFKPKAEETWEGDTLRIKMRCPVELARSCRAFYRIQVPERMPLTVRGGGGDVRILGLSGNVDIDTGGGNVLLENLVGDVDLVNDAGDVRIKDSRSKSVKAETRAGDTFLDFSAPPSNVDVRTTAGDLAVQVPWGSPYSIDAEAVGGSRTVEVQDEGAAPHRIQARVSAGHLSVRYGSGA